MRSKYVSAALPAIASAFLLALGGCAAGPEPLCDVDSSRRPFGRRFVHFFGMVYRTPGMIADDAVCRTETTGRNLQALAEGRWRELQTTGRRAADALPTVGEDSWCRLKTLGRLAADGARDALDDARCFIPTAWHSLKLAE